MTSYNRLGPSWSHSWVWTLDYTHVWKNSWKIGGFHFCSLVQPVWCSFQINHIWKPKSRTRQLHLQQAVGTVLNYSRKSDFNNMLSDPRTRITRTHGEDLIPLHLSSSSLSHPQSQDPLLNGYTFLSNGCQLNTFFDLPSFEVLATLRYFLIV